MAGLDALTFGPSGALRFARNSGRSITGEALGAIRYPSPFFDIAHTYLPTSFKTMLRWCRYYFLTNPLINAVCYKMAEYPVTDLVFDGESEHLNERWNKFFTNILHFKKFEVEAGLDFNTYGNAFISMYFPFQKMLKCKQCGRMTKINQQKYIFREYNFVGECQYCKYYGEFSVKDHYLRSARDIRLIRWNPEYITIQHNEATGENRYYYVIPPTLANDVRMAKRHIIEQIPQVFIEALRKNKALLFSRQNIYHMQRPTIAQKDRGWGMPMILPVLKDTFYLQVLRKAQECLVLSAFLETPHQLLRASEMRVGDLVKTHNGSYKRITAISPKTIDDSSGGFTLQVTTKAMKAFPTGYSDNHPLYILRRKSDVSGIRAGKHVNTKYVRRYTDEYEPQWVNAGDARIGEYVLYPTRREHQIEESILDLAKYIGLPATEKWIYQQSSLETALAYEDLEAGKKIPWSNNSQHAANQSYNRNKVLPRAPRIISITKELAYLAGWYIGDGSTSDRQISIALGLKDDHRTLSRVFKQIFGKKPKVSLSKRFNGRLLVFSDVIATKFMRGWIPGTAHTKQIPKEIQSSSDEILLSFLRGYIEADGCFHRGLDRISIRTSSFQLAYQVWKSLISLKCVARIVEHKESETTIEDKLGRSNIAKTGISYSVVLDGSSGRRLKALLYGQTPEEAEGGHTGFFFKDYFASPICGWERLTDRYVLSFEIEDDHTFCTPGMATHNSVAIEHIVPLRILFPQSASGTADVYSTINLSQWRDKIENELIRWRLDNNYIPILPVPVGQETLGGDGKALILAQEYRQWAEHIIAGMGVPIEFVFGGMQFSGSNVSMRILENHFLDIKTQRKQLVTDFIMPNTSAFMGWDPVPCHYKRFKMADDLQRSAFYMQLNQAGKICDKSLLEDTDWDSRKEAEAIERERKMVLEGQRNQALSQASIQGEAQLIMAKYQMRGQKLMTEMTPEATGQGMPATEPMPGMGQPGLASPEAEGQMMNMQTEMMNRSGQIPGMEIPPTQPVEQAGVNQGAGGSNPVVDSVQSQLPENPSYGLDLQSVANQVVKWLNKLPDNEKNHELVKMQVNNPHLYSLVLVLLQQSTGAERSSAAAPPPPQRTPRRGLEAQTS